MQGSVEKQLDDTLVAHQRGYNPIIPRHGSQCVSAVSEGKTLHKNARSGSERIHNGLTETTVQGHATR